MSAPVRLQFDALGKSQDGQTANISIGGMFVEAKDPRPVGTLLRYELQLGDGEPIKGVGEVVWIRHRPQGPEAPSGIGIQFGHLDEPNRERLKAAVLEALDSPEFDGLSDPVAEAAIERRSPPKRPTPADETAEPSKRPSASVPSSRAKHRKKAQPSALAMSGRAKVLLVILGLLALLFLLLG